MTLKTNDEYCNYCNERNDLIHMLVYCTRFRHQRQKLLPELNQEDNLTSGFFNLLNNLNEAKTRKIVILIHIIAAENVIE